MIVISTAIEGYKADIAQATAELDRCKAQLKERQTEFQAAQDVVAASKRKGEIMGTTKEDVVRRKGEHRIGFCGCDRDR